MLQWFYTQVRCKEVFSGVQTEFLLVSVLFLSPCSEHLLPIVSVQLSAKYVCFSGAGFKAIWRNSQSNLPAIEMLYSEVHCTEAEAHGTSRNIFHCNVKQDGKQKCDVTREAAGVACGPVPTHVPKGVS